MPKPPKFFIVRSLNARILSLLLVIGPLPLCILGGWTYQQTLATLTEERIEYMSGLRDAKKREVELYVFERLGDLVVLVADEQILRALELFATDRQQEPDDTKQRDEEKKRFSIWLEKYKSTYRYHDVSLVSTTGDVLYTSLGPGLQGQNLARGALAESGIGRAFSSASKGVAVQDFFPLLQERQQAVCLAAPVYRGDAQVGVVILQIAAQVIDDLMAQSSGLGESGEIFLVGKTAGGSALRSNRRGSRGRMGDPYSSPSLEAALAGRHGVVQWLDRSTVPVLTAHAPLAIPGVQWAIVLQIDKDEVEQSVNAWATLFALFAVTLSLLSIGLSWRLVRNMVTPMTALAQAARQIAGGAWSARVRMDREDEIGQLGDAFDRMADYIEEQNWLKSKINTLRDLLGRMVSEESLCRELITELATTIGAGQGAFYVRDEGDGRYHLVGSFAYQKRKHFEHAFAPGEYLIGQCALENQTFIHTHLPADYTEIGSGLGKSAPMNLILVPVVAGERVIGVMELASFQTFTPTHIALLEQVAPSLGLALERLRHTHRTAILLEEVQRQASELAVQQEELLQVNTTLEQQRHELAASEEELRVQNDMLGEKTRVLEQTNAELESKQEALQQMGADLMDKTRELERASRYKSEFLANMSHELRTPLNSILIIADNLLDNTENNLSDNQLTSARILRESGQDLLQLINGILDLAKIESGKMELRPQHVSLHALLNELQHSFLPVAEQKKLTFSVERDAALPDTLWMDPVKVQQVLRNLLANAFKFTQQGGVTLRLFHCSDRPTGCLATGPASQEGHLALAVTDTGIGVTEGDRTVIFDAFQQADGRVDRQFGGTGLGLSISKTLAELMQGTLCLTSTPGQGSTFTLLLPWKQVAPAAMVPSLPSAHSARPQVALPVAPLLLIIEDDPTFASFVSKQVVERGFAVHHAITGQQGLADIARLRPHGIILDLGLPDMDGWTLLQTVRNNPETNQIPVHVISAQEPPADLYQTGAVGFVRKPVSHEQLLHVLDRFVQPVGQERFQMLVIDSDPHFQAQIQSLTHDLPVTVTCVNDLLQAKVCLQSTGYACIILDPDLPEGGAQAVLRILSDQTRHAETEVILCSARELSRAEHDRFLPAAERILLKTGLSDGRLLDEITLFLRSLDRQGSHKPRRAPLLPGDTFFQGRTILVVDDDMRNTFALAHALEARGMRVSMAPDGAAALALLAQQPAMEILLMDVMMPGMDGLETIRRIRAQAHFKELPIIALTAKAMLGDREKALAAGASDYLAKPVDLARLFSMMRVWLYHRE